MLHSFATGNPEPDRRKYMGLPPFLESVWLGDTQFIAVLLQSSAQRLFDTLDPNTGMNALHIAVGRNNLEMTKLLVEAGIGFIPDNEGRMPSLIAAICEASEELSDYILAAEERALEGQTPVDPLNNPSP